LEAAGVPTLSLTSALSITRSVGAPRGAFVDFPLGHTAGRPHDPALQRALMLEALSAFHELDAPGAIKRLPFRWSEDEGWREEDERAATAAGEGGGRTGDSRTPRAATPQYQSGADRDAAERLHRSGPCGCCVGAE
jgi:hypothetical protein